MIIYYNLSYHLFIVNALFKLHAPWCTCPRLHSIAVCLLSTNAHWLQTPLDNHLRLVMLVVAQCCTWQSRVPNIDCCTPEIWPWPLSWTRDLDPELWPWSQPLTLILRRCNSDVKTQIWGFDLDLWPMTLTYNPNLTKVKVDLHTKYQARRSNSVSQGVLITLIPSCMGSCNNLRMCHWVSQRVIYCGSYTCSSTTIFGSYVPILEAMELAAVK